MIFRLLKSVNKILFYKIVDQHIMGSIDGIPEDAPQIRLCHIKKRSDFNGYGFNLHAEKSKPGQFIGTVDERSPAERAGLK